MGKTTLIIRTFESLKSSNPALKLQGFYTRMSLLLLPLSVRVIFSFQDEHNSSVIVAGEIREGRERVGFEVVTLDGRKAPLATTSTSRFSFASIWCWWESYFPFRFFVKSDLYSAMAVLGVLDGRLWESSK